MLSALFSWWEDTGDVTWIRTEDEGEEIKVGVN